MARGYSTPRAILGGRDVPRKRRPARARVRVNAPPKRRKVATPRAVLGGRDVPRQTARVRLRETPRAKLGGSAIRAEQRQIRAAQRADRPRVVRVRSSRPNRQPRYGPSRARVRAEQPQRQRQETRKTQRQQVRIRNRRISRENARRLGTPAGPRGPRATTKLERQGGTRRQYAKAKRTDQGSDLGRAIDFATLVGGPSAVLKIPKAIKAGRAAVRGAGRVARRPVVRVQRATVRSQRVPQPVRRAAARRTERQATIRAATRSGQAKRARIVRRQSPKLKRRVARSVQRRKPSRAGVKGRALNAQLQAAPIAASSAGVGGAIVAGHVEALKEKPGKTLATTARAVPGLVTSPLGAAANVGLSAYRAERNAKAKLAGEKQPYTSKQVREPTTKTAQSAIAFGKEMARDLGSGDSERVKKAVEEKYGLTLPLMAAPGLARAGRAPYRRARAASRRQGEAKRAAKGTQRRPPTEQPQGRSRRIERRQVRVRQARKAATTRRRGQVSSYRAAKPVLKAARKAEGARGTIRRRNVAVEPGDLIGLLAREGINLDRPDLAPRQVARVREKFGRERHPRVEGVSPHDVLDFIEANPKVLRDPRVREAVGTYRRQAKDIETSQRAKHFSVATTHGIRLPEERLPHEIRGVATGTRSEVKTAVAKGGEDVRRLRELERAALALKNHAGRLRAEVRQLERTEPTGRPLKLRREKLAQAKLGEGRAREEMYALRQRNKTVRAAVRKPDEKALEDEFVREAREALEREGLAEPAYTHQADLLRNATLGSTRQRIVRAGKKQHQRKGILEAEGRIDESLQALVSGSIVGPRLRREIHRHTDEFTSEEALPISVRDRAGNVSSKRLVTRGEAAQAHRDGQFDPRHATFLPLQQFKQAVLDPGISADRIEEMRAGLAESLKGEIIGRGKSPGEKGIVVDREAAKEFFAQMEPPGGSGAGGEAVAAASWPVRISSKLLLGTSPAWALSQIVAEGAQAAVAVSRPVLAARALKAAQRLAEKDPEGYAAWAALAGETPGVTIRPRDLQLSLRPETNTWVSNAFRAMDRSAAGRIVKSVAALEPLSVFDRWKGAKIRQAVAGAHVQREFNQTVLGISKLWGKQREVAAKLKGVPLEDQMAYIARNPKLAREIEDYLDDTMGNWSALTRFEKVAAPLSIFYPFLRMSLRWVFWSFPKRHPIKSAMLTYLGQWNANELAKMLGGDADFFLQYANAPIRGGEDGRTTGLLPLSRIAPGSNALVEAVGEGKPTQLLRTLNPAVVALIVATTGVDPLSGEQADRSKWGTLALSQLLALPSPVRAIDTLRGPREKGALPIVGPRKDDNALTRLVAKLSGSREQRAVRGIGFPFVVSDADDQAELARLGRILDRLKRKPKPAEIAAATSREELKELARRKADAEKASDELDAMFRRHHIGQAAEKKRVKRNFKAVPTFPRKSKPQTVPGNPWISPEPEAKSGQRASTPANPWK